MNVPPPLSFIIHSLHVPHNLLLVVRSLSMVILSYLHDSSPPDTKFIPHRPLHRDPLFDDMLCSSRYAVSCRV